MRLLDRRILSGLVVLVGLLAAISGLQHWLVDLNISPKLQVMEIRQAAQAERMARSFDHLESRFDRLDGRFDRLDNKIDRLDRRFDRLDSKFDHLDDKFDRLEGKFDDLTSLILESRSEFK